MSCRVLVRLTAERYEFTIRVVIIRVRGQTSGNLEATNGNGSNSDGEKTSSIKKKGKK